MGLLLAENIIGSESVKALIATDKFNFPGTSETSILKYFATTGNGMLEVIEAMGKHLSAAISYSLEYSISLHKGTFSDDKNAQPHYKALLCMTIDGVWHGIAAKHPTSLPRAVAVAALLAVKEKGKVDAEPST